VILRGKTAEVIDQITDGELDLAYIDADHTLKGIAIDLIRVYPKVRDGGFLGGDDFTTTLDSSRRWYSRLPDILRKPSAPPSTRCRTRSSVSRKRVPHNSPLSISPAIMMTSSACKPNSHQKSS